jgi:hypothetical protein
MSRDLPSFNASVGFDALPSQNLDEGLNAQMAALQSFNQGAQSIAEEGLKLSAEQNKNTLKYNISKAYEGFSNEAIKNPDAISAQKNFLAESKSYQQQLAGQSNFINRGFVNNLAQSYEESYNKKLATNTLQQAKFAQIGNAIIQDNQAGSDITNSILTADPKLGDNQFQNAHALIANRNQQLQYNLVHGLISPAQFKSASDTYPLQYAALMITKGYQDRLNSGKADEALQFLSQATRSFQEKFSPDQFHKLQGMVTNETASFINSAGVSQKLLKSQFESEVQAAGKTGQPVSSSLLAMVKSTDPKNADYYDFTAKQANWSAQYYKLATTTTPDQGRIAVNQVKDKAQRLLAQQAYTAGRKQLLDNPAETASQSPAVQEAAKMEQASSVTGNNKIPTGFTALGVPTPNSTDAIVKWQLAHGFSMQGSTIAPKVQPLFKAYADKFMNAWNQSNPVDKVKLMQQLQDQTGSGQNFSLALDQLHTKYNLPSDAKYLGLVDPTNVDINTISSALSTPITEMQKAMKTSDPDLQKDVDTKVNNAVFNLEADPNSFFPSTSPVVKWQESMQGQEGFGDPTVNNALKSALQKLAYQNVLTGKASSAEDAFDMAGNQLFSNINFVLHKGQMLAIPKNINSDAVLSHADTWQEKVPELSWKVSDSDPSGEYSPDEAKNNNKKLIETGHWGTDSSGHQLVWVNAAGQIPLLDTGKPLEFSYSDAQNYLMNDEKYIKSKLQKEPDFAFVFGKHAQHIRDLRDNLEKIKKLEVETKQVTGGQ